MASVMNIDEDSSMEHQIIARNLVKKFPNGELETLDAFWKDQPAVIVFLRRFGCMFCRVGAKEISRLKPLLDSHNITLVGIGLEELGASEFFQGKFFSGDLYIDERQQCYYDLQYKRFNAVNILPSLFSRKGWDAITKGRQENVGNNFKGDGLQNGGVLIVSAGGGKTLLNWRQENPAETIDLQLVLDVLGISGTLPKPSQEVTVAPRKLHKKKQEKNPLCF